MNKVFLSLGSNLGDRVGLLKSAVEIFQEKYGIVNKSPVYKTPPWGFYSEHDFLNMCISFLSSESPQVLLSYCLEIENQLGRKRNDAVKGYFSRKIDIDIIYFGNRIINESLLQVPHPKLYSRNFVLIPLNDLAPDFIDPCRNASVSFILNECDDKSIIHFYSTL
jgi:2-amino-4-hydroxy-6-hydroxymethyldihydropteridine diphosphokinase